MNIESILSFIVSTWHIAPVRWAIYATIVLWVLFVYVMRLKRIRDNEGLSLVQKIVGYPIAVVGVIVDWLYNWTVASILYRELPHSWKELTTQRLQRALDNPVKYAGYRLTLARWLKPQLNKHDKGHLE